jgi:hypothetical protein
LAEIILNGNTAIFHLLVFHILLASRGTTSPHCVPSIPLGQHLQSTVLRDEECNGKLELIATKYEVTNPVSLAGKIGKRSIVTKISSKFLLKNLNTHS